jgi:hypothetical protein
VLTIIKQEGLVFFVCYFSVPSTALLVTHNSSSNIIIIINVDKARDFIFAGEDFGKLLLTNSLNYFE